VIDRRELEAFEASALAGDEVRRMLGGITRSVATEVPQQSSRRVDVAAGLWRHVTMSWARETIEPGDTAGKICSILPMPRFVVYSPWHRLTPQHRSLAS
jgi:hypothetical protein